jgi:glycosyltransferase 2 family protein
MARSSVKIAFKLAVSAALVASILLVVPWTRLWESVRSLDPRTWLAVWGGFVAGHALGVFKWRYNVNLGIRSERAKLSGVDAVQCYAAGMFANLCLPSIVGGDALKALLAAKVTGRAEAAVIGGLTERLIDTFALLVLIVVGALWSRETMPDWAQNVVQVAALVAIAGTVLVLPLAMRTKLERWPRKVRRTVGRAMVATRRLLERPHRALFVLALSFSIQGWFVVLNAELGRGIGIDAPIAVWFFAVPMAKAITLAPISFGGFGVREVTLAGFLEALRSVPRELGVAASALWQTVLVATGLAGGALWFVLGFRASARTGAGHGSLLAERRAPASGVRADGVVGDG